MENTKKIHLITENYLRDILSSKGFWIPTIICFVGSIISYWDDSHQRLIVLMYSMFRGNRSIALQTLFFDWYIMWCLFVGLFFFFPKVTTPIKDSFTISNTLWLKFANTTNMNLAFSRAYILLFSVLLNTLISLLWAIIFAFRHGIVIDPLLYPIVGIACYMLFSGSLATILSSIRVRENNIRLVLSLFALLLPFAISTFEDELRTSLKGYFPNTLPVYLTKLDPSNMKEYLVAALISILLLSVHILTNYFYHLKFFKNEKA